MADFDSKYIDLNALKMYKDKADALYATKIAKYSTVTLLSTGWDSTAKTQTVAVTGFNTNTMLATPNPAGASTDEYASCSVRAISAQDTNKVTFKCDTIPTSNLTVYMQIIQTIATA